MRIVKLISVFISLVLLTSCMPQNTEIKYRLVTEGIGVDYDSENGVYELTVQVLQTSESAPEQGKSATPVINYTVTGQTIAQAMTSLGENTGKYPLYSQNRLILLGSSVTDGQMIKALDFFVREYTSRPDVFVAAASGKASEVLTADTSGEVPAKLIESAIRQSSENSVAVDTQLYNAVNLSLEEGSCFTLPLIEVTEDRIPEKKTIKVTGTRACRKSAEPVMMSDKETMFFLFAADKIKAGSFSIVADEYSAALEIIRSATKTKLTLNEGKPELTFEVVCEVDIVEFDSSSFSSFNENDVSKTEKAAQEYISQGMSDLLDRFLKREKCDIFRAGTRVRQKYPSVYEALSSVADIDYSVSVTVDVGRIGQMTVKK